MTSLRFVLTGAGGHLGVAILKELSKLDCEIYGFLMQGTKPSHQNEKIRYFYGDVREMDTLEPMFSEAAHSSSVSWERSGNAISQERNSATIVIHTAALISIDIRKNALIHDVNVGGTENVVQLCKKYQVKRLVHVSSVHAIPELPNGQTMTEPASYSPDKVVGCYAKTKAEAAQVVLNAVQDGLDAVLVFPSGIIGPYDSGKNHLVQVAVEYMKGLLPACVKGGYDMVDVRDVATGCVSAALHGVKGESYILSGNYMTIQEYLAMTGKYFGKKPVPALPRFLVKMGLPFVWLHAKVWKRRPLYTRYSLYALASNGMFSREKARKELGYKPRAISETIHDMVSWLNNHGIVSQKK